MEDLRRAENAGPSLLFLSPWDNNESPQPVENYFNYFTEIEEHYQRRRGTGLLLSTLDWALIETWKDAGIPLEAVLSGIATTFDKYDRRPGKTRKINSLAYCAQEVLAAAEETKEAAIGAQRQDQNTHTGMTAEEICTFLLRNVQALGQIKSPAQVQAVAQECSETLSAMAEAERTLALPGSVRTAGALEDLERHLTVLEEKLLAALTLATPEAELAGLRAEADRAIGPYRSKMPGFQIEQLHKQFVHKRLFEKAKIPRLSLFYM
jgi:hypothetical protein